MKLNTWMAMGTFIVGMVFVLIGVHNIDQAFNMSLNIDWEYEMFLNKVSLNPKGTYLLGVQMVAIGISFFIGSFLLLLINEIDFNNIFKSVNAK